ncbi:Predicted kinase, aminoglycoside phosphotransferase (APT) family [Nakamurella panacisegetis]|uniref:Predicted kinase, aminoglycoside phosphotransferase (APT) family n=1 Tax=Nakamurella panacisegetis TaxID=1090615 RepID=A0A1H0SYL7_9ACTN|nr:aminoglycoside phosphotransferase family protein [Nakamurella panacisegetis]SDP46917.1 Predicted kinase, aminoglycoside phosphotransferase (APT) family [Nakamurella panacisegetis]
MVRTLHSDEIPIDAELVRGLIRRAMPAYADEPVRRLPSTGSTNALFRLGKELLVRLPRQPGGSADIAKEATWLPVLGPLLPVSVPEVVGVFDADRFYPEQWSVVRWIDGTHPEVVDPGTATDPRRQVLAANLAAVLRAFRRAEVSTQAVRDPRLRSYRGRALTTMDEATRENIERCRSLEGFGFDLDAAEQIWGQAMQLPETGGTDPCWYHGDLAAENLLVRDETLIAVLDFGGLSIGDPTVDLVVAWEILDPPAREAFRRQTGVDDLTWLRGRALALSITLMIWYYWTTMPGRRARCMAVGQNVLMDAGYPV